MPGQAGWGLRMTLCKTCRFFIEHENDVGECRRFPPTVVMQQNHETRTVFPRVYENYWCGEHDSKPDADEVSA